MVTYLDVHLFLWQQEFKYCYQNILGTVACVYILKALIVLCIYSLSGTTPYVYVHYLLIGLYYLQLYF